MNGQDYEEYLANKFSEFESLCKKCGMCCGAGDDPCFFLSKNPDGTYFCRIYKTRLGERETISGKKFRCVEIRENIPKRGLHPSCAYRVLY
ncbi:MAG: hypothetical protein HQL28_00145 [Candidatus Omnitrophica bacterium]|nr:hypothetical protein [Candidatus Omnitrophota bacterium]